MAEESGGRPGAVVDSITTRALVIVDEEGIARARLGVMSDGSCRFVLLDDDGFERIGLSANHEVGIIDLAPRTRFDHGTRVRLFAHDPSDGAEYGIGVHLVVRGEAVAGFEVLEGAADPCLDRVGAVHRAAGASPSCSRHLPTGPRTRRRTGEQRLSCCRAQADAW